MFVLKNTALDFTEDNEYFIESIVISKLKNFFCSRPFNALISLSYFLTFATYVFNGIF